MPNIVKRFNEAVATLSPISATTPLPSGSVCMISGNYLFNGAGYDCTEPGLYLFWTGSGVPINARLVWRRGAGNVMTEADLMAFISGISWHHTHGTEDDGAAGNLQLLSNAGMTRKWRLSCGHIAAYCHWLLPQLGIQTRTIQLNTQGPTNGLDDGHIIFEVFRDNKWKAFDLTNGVWFRKDGVHLSTAEFIAAGVLNCERVSLDNDSKRNVSFANNFCQGSYNDLTQSDPGALDAWYARIFQSWYVM